VLLIHKTVRYTDQALIDELDTIIELLEKGKFDEACGYTVKLDEIISSHRNNIKSLITTRFKPIFIENRDYTFSYQQIKNKGDFVYQWLDEISQYLQEFRNDLRKHEAKTISVKLKGLQEKIAYNNPINDLADALTSLATEYISYLRDRPKDELSQLFDRLNFHKIVRESSEKLFKDGHNAPAILEASKSLIRYVRNKSKLQTKNDRTLMFDAFLPKKEGNTLNIIKPALCLNALIDETDWNEQEGFAYIFNGVVAGIRNPKAHDTIVQKDPYKTLEYLALISLLAKRTDEAKLSTKSKKESDAKT
jgi:uncharacterized protein (TIGR02391 family)